ncbi:hypothetical protein CGLO_01845 [Colletotrichum gloeosporioides Cg-14]|uniref:Uncharacterized protein n=1 Tax=Colletotrichum gloeosporioides (strain Cg-14) TaxID=1237896 RepID=T0MAQ9_COLGC|nr:hypothetical protein CGLO_01845 [Colletotrichum gloeosporioides Cg-14]
METPSNYPRPYSTRQSAYSGEGWAEPSAKPFLDSTTTVAEVKSQFDYDEDEPKRRFFPGRSNKTGPKAVIRGTAKRFFLRWLVHAPAIAVTCGIIWISHMQLFWYPEHGVEPFSNIHVRLSATVISNLLQLASKIHEIMIVASLASISVAMFKRRLVGKGVRLGFLTGGYRVGDLEYLLSGAFWKQGKGVTLNIWEIGLVTYLVFATIMSTVVGPASAILLVPSLGWFDLDGAFQDVRMPLSYGASPQEAWPRSLNSSLFDSTPECNTTEALYTYWCPVGGFSDIWNWAEGFRYAGLTDNITFQHPSTELRRRLSLSEHVTQNDGSVLMFTTPSSSIMTTIGLFANYISRKPVPIGTVTDAKRYQLRTTTPLQQPFVHGKCVLYDRDQLLQDKVLPSFPVSALNCYGDAGCLRVQQDKPTFKSKTWNDTSVAPRMTYNLHYYDKKSPGGAMLIAGTIPYVGDGSKQRLWVYTCSFLPRWVPASFTLDSGDASMLLSNFSSADDMTAMLQNTTAQSDRVVQADPSWVRLIDPEFNMTRMLPGNSTPSVSATSPIKLILNQFLDSREQNGTKFTYMDTVDGNQKSTEIFLTKVFGVFLTDSLARTSSHERAALILEETDTSMKWIDLKEQMGYESGVHRVEAQNNKTYPSLSYWNNYTDPMPLALTVSEVAQELRNTVQVDFETQRYGYGSGQFTKTLQFALVMMYIYLAVVGIYGFTIFSSHATELMGQLIGRRRFHLRSVVGWGDLADLMLLALRSNPPDDVELNHVGAGVRKSPGVWNKVVKVRIDEDNKVQMVLHERRGMSPPKRNVLYS